MPKRQQFYLALLLVFFALLGLAAQLMFQFDPASLMFITGTLQSHAEVERTETVKGKGKKPDEIKTYRHIELQIHERNNLRVRIDEGVFPKPEGYAAFLTAADTAEPGTAVAFHIKTKDLSNIPAASETPPTPAKVKEKEEALPVTPAVTPEPLPTPEPAAPARPRGTGKLIASETSADSSPRITVETLTLGKTPYVTLDDRANHYAVVRRNAAWLGAICGLILIPVLWRLFRTKSAW
jgi:hypothetical protein